MYLRLCNVGCVVGAQTNFIERFLQAFSYTNVIKAYWRSIRNKLGRWFSNRAKYSSWTASERSIVVKNTVFDSLRIFQQMGKNRQIYAFLTNKGHQELEGDDGEKNFFTQRYYRYML